MSTPRFIADTHLGHKNISKYRKVFESTLHNDLFFMEVLESTCTKRDIMYFLGDSIFDKKYIPFIKSLPGVKILIMGNHDSEYVDIKELVNGFDEIHSLVKYKEFWLSHAPIHYDELRGKKNIHGHVHTNSVQSTDYLNVSVDSSFMKYYPRTLNEVRNAFKDMESTGNVYQGIDDADAYDIITNNVETRDIYFKTLKESRKIIV